MCLPRITFSLSLAAHFQLSLCIYLYFSFSSSLLFKYTLFPLRSLSLCPSPISSFSLPLSLLTLPTSLPTLHLPYLSIPLFFSPILSTPILSLPPSLLPHSHTSPSISSFLLPLIAFGSFHVASFRILAATACHHRCPTLVQRGGGGHLAKEEGEEDGNR